MAKLNGGSKLGIAVAVVVAVILFSYAYVGMKPPSPSSTGGATTTPTASTTPAAPASGTQYSPTAGQVGSNVPVSSPALSPEIHFVTPVTNDQWKMGSQNPIVWDQEAGVTAEIDLLNASNLAVAGVILSEAGPHQTSYTWDTRQIYLSRYSPLKKDIVPGSYVIRLKFDGNNLQNLVSPVFTVTQ